MATYEIIRDDGGVPIEARVTLDDGRIACAGIVAGQLRENTDIPDETVRAIMTELGA
jgi:hypothetical protein